MSVCIYIYIYIYIYILLSIIHAFMHPLVFLEHFSPE